MIVVISLDGVCHEDVDFNILPNLKSLADQGVYTKRMRVAFPSTTWINHTCAITGKGPDKHGVLGGRTYSRSKKTAFGYFEAPIFDIKTVPIPTIFDKAAEKGKTTAAICWPLSQGSSNIRYNIPEFYKQDHFDNYSTPDLIKELIAHNMEFENYADWSNDKKLSPLQDDLTCRITEYLISNKPIDLLFAHFLIHDSYQHILGIHTPETKWSLKYLDGLVGRIVNTLKSAKLFEESHIIIMSDHGHEALNKYFDLKSFIKQQGIPDGTLEYVNNGGALHIYPKKDNVPEKLITDLSAALEKHEAVEFTILKEQAAKYGLNPKALPDTYPDIIIGLNHGWCLLDKPYKGTHGFLPETHPRMDSFMIRSGKSFPKGTKEESGHICNIYGIVEKLLDM